MSVEQDRDGVDGVPAVEEVDLSVVLPSISTRNRLLTPPHKDFATNDMDDESTQSLAIDGPGPMERIQKGVKNWVDVTGLSKPKRMIPVVTWIGKYGKEYLVGDAVAGITVGLMVIPQAIAYANLAGLPPIYGLYSSFMGGFVYTIFGTAKDIAVGPTALMSLIVSESFTKLEHPPDGFENLCSDIQSSDYCCVDGDDYACTPVKLAVAATMVAGIYQVVMGFLNFGAVIDFIGFPVFNGFTTAAAITIFTSQIRHILGLTNIDRHWMFTVRDILTNLGDSRWQDFVMGALCMILTFVLEKVKAEYNDRRTFSRKEYFYWLAGTARNAIVVVLALLISRIVAATEAGDTVFKLVYDVPRGAPDVQDPLSGIDSDDMSEVLTASITISLLGYLESIAIGKAFAQKNGYDIDSTQEMRALGYSSVASAFFQSYPITGSFSRTAVNSASSVKTPMGGVFTGLLVIISLEVLTPAFYYIPKAALAAIIMMSVVHMVDIAEVRRIARVKPQDLAIWMTSFLACLLWSLEFGILLAIVVSAILSLYNTSAQTLSRLRRDEKIGVWVADPDAGTDGLPKSWVPTFIADASAASPLVIKIDGDIVFSMANKLKDRMAAIHKWYASENESRALIIDMSGVSQIDYSGVLALESILESFKPGTYTYKAKGGETFVVDGEMCTRKKGEVYTKRLRGIRVHVAHVNSGAYSILRSARLIGGKLPQGEWKLTMHATIDAAVDALHDDYLRVEARWPFDWMVPAKLAKFFDADQIVPGRTETPVKNWKCFQKKNGDKIWMRAIDNLKMSEV